MKGTRNHIHPTLGMAQGHLTAWAACLCLQNDSIHMQGGKSPAQVYFKNLSGNPFSGHFILKCQAGNGKPSRMKASL